jgi:phosphatidylserine/phosphatidylglycerophosphate/cardiolipin synthase-like enzyme
MILSPEAGELAQYVSPLRSTPTASKIKTMSWPRATASIKASTEHDPRESSNLQARKPVPSRLVIYLLLGLLVFCAPYVLAAEIAVCFTPEYGMTPSCTQEVVEALTGAKKSVLVQAYSFISAPIAKALVDAHRRGVEVKVILDRSNRTAHYSAVPAHNISLRMDGCLLYQRTSSMRRRFGSPN